MTADRAWSALRNAVALRDPDGEQEPALDDYSRSEAIELLHY
jgi:hypothetical protein